MTLVGIMAFGWSWQLAAAGWQDPGGKGQQPPAAASFALWKPLRTFDSGAPKSRLHGRLQATARKRCSPPGAAVGDAQSSRRRVDGRSQKFPPASDCCLKNGALTITSELQRYLCVRELREASASASALAPALLDPCNDVTQEKGSRYNTTLRESMTKDGGA
ncbi:hypothetical protein E4U54_004126 [Claviceps lovelessii]|nr:hypothetical protein E4U54_004126 [Claviceps lovelessii]